jgi:DNA helicase-2/ATP-dependent DNA helicase PcrA
MRQADLVQLEQIAAGYPSRERFLTELTLDPPDATSDQAGVPLLDEDYLILSTIHSAKGPGCVKTRSIVVLIACAMARARIWRIGAAKFRESSPARFDDILR